MKYSFLHNPIDIEELEKLRLNAREKIKLRKKYHINENDFIIWKVWRANLWKWEDAIIDIVWLLKNKVTNLKIVIRAIPKIKKQQIKKLWIEKYFIFLDETVNEIEIAETYQLMNIMLHTSRIWESFGIAISEWMFFWLPIITKSTNFLEKTLVDRDNAQVEIVQNHENWLISNDLDEVCDYILALSHDQNKLNQISINNIKRVKSCFSAQTITEKLEDIFNWVNDFTFDFQEEFTQYKKTQIKESFYELIKINIRSLYDKYINKA